MVRRANDTNVGSAHMHLGKGEGFDTLRFLADLAALPWGPSVHGVPGRERGERSLLLSWAKAGKDVPSD
jgi:hypothetical protein